MGYQIELVQSCSISSFSSCCMDRAMNLALDWCKYCISRTSYLRGGLWFVRDQMCSTAILHETFLYILYNGSKLTIVFFFWASVDTVLWSPLLIFTNCPDRWDRIGLEWGEHYICNCCKRLELNEVIGIFESTPGSGSWCSRSICERHCKTVLCLAWSMNLCRDCTSSTNTRWLGAICPQRKSRTPPSSEWSSGQRIQSEQRASSGKNLSHSCGHSQLLYRCKLASDVRLAP